MLMLAPSGRPTSILGILLIALLGLVCTGCGDDDGDFLVNSDGVVNIFSASTGSLSFQFVKPQAAAVPAATTMLTFEFYDNAIPEHGTLVYAVILPYSDSIIVEEVPVSARSVVITAAALDTTPLASIEDQVVVVPDTVTAVDLSDAAIRAIRLESISISPDTVDLKLGNAARLVQHLSVLATFSNGETLALDNRQVRSDVTFSSEPPGVVSISDSGLVKALASGETVVTVSYNTGGLSQSDTVLVIVSQDLVGGAAP